MVLFVSFYDYGVPFGILKAKEQGALAFVVFGELSDLGQ